MYPMLPPLVVLDALKDDSEPVVNDIEFDAVGEIVGLVELYVDCSSPIVQKVEESAVLLYIVLMSIE